MELRTQPAVAMLTALRPEPDLLALCYQHGITPVRITAEPTTSADPACVDARLVARASTRLWAMTENPSLTVLVRPDRVIAAVAT